MFLAGFFELSFSSMAQTLVQMNAPEAIRGRVLGLFNMSSAGLRAFSGITVGLAGSLADDPHVAGGVGQSRSSWSIGFVVVRRGKTGSAA